MSPNEESELTFAVLTGRRWKPCVARAFGRYAPRTHPIQDVDTVREQK